jgi:hypothetical protein
VPPEKSQKAISYHLGIFIGPVVLGVSHTLLKAWMPGEEQEAVQAATDQTDRVD